MQQIENNLLVPKIQGDAVELHPAAVIFAIIIGGALAGLLGAILALPVTAAARDVVRYLFRRAQPGRLDAPWPTRSTALGLETHPGVPGRRGLDDHGERAGVSGSDPYKVLQVDPGGGGRGHRRRVSTAGPQIPPGYRDRGRVERRGWRRSTPPGSVLGDPARRAAYDRAACASRRRLQEQRGERLRGGAGCRPRLPRDRRRRRQARPATPSPSPRPSRATGRAVARRSVAATTRRCARRRHGRRRPAAGQPIGQRHELRSLRRLVARGDRAGGPRVPRVARPDADRPAVSRRDRRDPAADGPASLGRRPKRATGGGCSAGADAPRTESLLAAGDTLSRHHRSMTERASPAFRAAEYRRPRSGRPRHRRGGGRAGLRRRAGGDPGAGAPGDPARVSSSRRPTGSAWTSSADGSRGCCSWPCRASWSRPGSWRWSCTERRACARTWPSSSARWSPRPIQPPSLRRSSAWRSTGRSRRSSTGRASSTTAPGSCCSRSRSARSPSRSGRRTRSSRSSPRSCSALGSAWSAGVLAARLIAAVGDHLIELTISGDPRLRHLPRRGRLPSFGRHRDRRRGRRARQLRPGPRLDGDGRGCHRHRVGVPRPRADRGRVPAHRHGDPAGPPAGLARTDPVGGRRHPPRPDAHRLRPAGGRCRASRRCPASLLPCLGRGSTSCSGPACAGPSPSRWRSPCRSTCRSGRCCRRSRSVSCCSRCSSRPPRSGRVVGRAGPTVLAEQPGPSAGPRLRAYRASLPLRACLADVDALQDAETDRRCSPATRRRGSRTAAGCR